MTLTFVKESGKDRYGHKQSLYKCGCGKNHVARDAQVKCGDITSCGCRKMNNKKCFEEGRLAASNNRIFELTGVGEYAMNPYEVDTEEWRCYGQGYRYWNLNNSTFQKRKTA